MECSARGMRFDVCVSNSVSERACCVLRSSLAKVSRDRKQFEHRSGFELWNSRFTSVTCLTLNMRTTGILVDILQGMRSGSISDTGWKTLQGRVLGNYIDDRGNLQRYPEGVCDPRLGEEPFLSNPVNYIVHRHQLRVCQSFCNSLVVSAAMSQRLYVSVALDEVAEGSGRLTDEVRLKLLKMNNLRQVKNLPATLPLFKGMRLLLYSKECVRLQLMNGCLCILEDIIFAEDETLPPAVRAGEPVLLEYLPAYLLLRATDARWMLPKSMLPSLPADYNLQGLFLMAPDTDYIVVNTDVRSKLNVRRTHFKVVPADSRVVYAAQGEGFKAYLPDLARPPSMSKEVHWLASYVMLSRGESLDSMLILRLCTREELTTGAPAFLIAEIDRLLMLERKSWSQLSARLQAISPHVDPALRAVLADVFNNEETGVLDMGVPTPPGVQPAPTPVSTSPAVLPTACKRHRLRCKTTIPQELKPPAIQHVTPSVRPGRVEAAATCKRRRLWTETSGMQEGMAQEDKPLLESAPRETSSLGRLGHTSIVHSHSQMTVQGDEPMTQGTYPQLSNCDTDGHVGQAERQPDDGQPMPSIQTPSAADAELSCTSCGRLGHASNAHPQCLFYERERNVHLDAHGGSSVQHMSQTSIQILADGIMQCASRRKPYWYEGHRLRIMVDDQQFALGKASGEGCNCLIDTLRQKLGVASCNIADVRRRLEALHELCETEILPHDYLSLDYWEDIISLITEQSGHSAGTVRAASRFQVNCIDLTWIGHGEVLPRGARKEPCTVLHLARVNQNHFVPLTPLLDVASSTAASSSAA